MPGTFTSPDSLYKPAAGELGWDANENTNWDTLQALVNTHMGSGRPLSATDPHPTYDTAAEAQARVDALKPEFVLLGKASTFFTPNQPMVQTDLRAFKTAGNSWNDAITAAFVSITAGAVYCAPELGAIDISAFVDTPARKYLYSPLVRGLSPGALTSGGPGFRLHPTSSMTTALKLNGQGAGAYGIAVLDDSGALTSSGIQAAADEVWAFGVATQVGNTLPYGIDFSTTSRSGVSHFSTSGGLVGISIFIDGNVLGPARVKAFNQTGIEMGAGCLAMGPFHITSGQSGTTGVVFRASYSTLMGFYLDSETVNIAAFKAATGGACRGNNLIGGRAYHDLATGSPKNVVLYDSTNGDCENNLIDDFTVDIPGGETNWDYLATFVAPANNNRRHQLGIVRGVNVTDLCLAADRKRFSHVGMLTLGSGAVMRSNGAVALTDGASVAVDLTTGDTFTLDAAGSRTIANPTNVATGRQVAIRIKNTTGGAITTTWSANYKLAGAWVDPAASKKRTIRFMAEDDGTLVELGRSAADI
ncbi:MAG TPA: hypothetical protein VGR13_04185 [Actinomycetota bacterium]|jgi:hypothetical protein|nr:hypothetical protein [Actinomycetota bacterium]